MNFIESALAIMDISLVFKETIQSILIQHTNARSFEETNILNRKRKKNSFMELADILRNQINELYKAIRGNVETCLTLSNFLTKKSYMSNTDHNNIDFLIQTMTNDCLRLVEELKGRMANASIPQQSQEHRKIIIFIIEEYFNSICKIYSEKKIKRTKKAVLMRQVFKLKSWKITATKNKIPNCTYETHNTIVDSNTNQVNSFEIQEINGDICELTNVEEEQLNPKDIQLFEAENEKLHNELNALTEDMKNIENKVVYISELHNVFSEKILDQDKCLENVLSIVVGSTENVKEANEQIRNAIQRNAGFRVWILFFLLVLSFSLIFIDWYKP